MYSILVSHFAAEFKSSFFGSHRVFFLSRDAPDILFGNIVFPCCHVIPEYRSIVSAWLRFDLLT